MKRFVLTASEAMIARGLGADVLVASLRGVADLKGGGKPHMAEGSYDEARFAELEEAFLKLVRLPAG